MTIDNQCFIIAELSGNHGKDMNLIKESIRGIKRSGADAVKLQTLSPDLLTLDIESDIFLANPDGPWAGQKLFDLYQETMLPWEWHQEIFAFAQSLDLVCFSSPFGPSAVDFLEQLNCPIYKIASFEITDIPLIEKAAATGKPIIISTGIANYDDIELAIQTCYNVGNQDVTILKCTSSYPAPIEEADLSMIKHIANDFGVKTGLSDHTLGYIAPVLSIAFGASVIEKHFILNKSIKSPDAHFSLDEKEFTQMVSSVRSAEQAIGTKNYQLTPKQQSSRKYSRSLFVSQFISAGEPFTAENVKSIRPGLGLHPKHYSSILGKTAKLDIEAGTPLSLDLINL